MVCNGNYAMDASFLSVHRAITSVVPSTPRIFKSSPARFSAKRPEVTLSSPCRTEKEGVWKSRAAPGRNWNPCAYNNGTSAEQPCHPV